MLSKIGSDVAGGGTPPLPRFVATSTDPFKYNCWELIDLRPDQPQIIDLVRNPKSTEAHQKLQVAV